MQRSFSSSCLTVGSHELMVPCCCAAPGPFGAAGLPLQWERLIWQQLPPKTLLLLHPLVKACCWLGHMPSYHLDLSHGDSLYLTLINHGHTFLPFGGTLRFVARSHGLCRGWRAPDHVQRGCSSPETPASTTAGLPLTARSRSPCRALALTASGHARQCPMEILPPRLGYAQVRNPAALLPRTDNSNKYRRK